jgi:hypothetical protein
VLYIKLCFVITDVGNLDTKLEGYFKLSFITAMASNLDVECDEVILNYV